MTAISTAYDEEEKRSFVKKRALALALTVGAIVFLIVMLSLVAVFPACRPDRQRGGPASCCRSPAGC